MTRTARPAAPRPAFTLVEILIAVGAVALIAVGIAKVFQATGDTLRVGRRLNHLNTYAASIERQMRQDIARMSRDGFLVIRNELANKGEPVALYENQPPLDTAKPARKGRQRPRRVDELMFFATGDFVSLREPIHPSRIARSNEARIYYGHGLLRAPNPSNPPGNDPFYVKPVYVDDDNTQTFDGVPAPYTLGFAPPGGVTEPLPNRYAQDWTLLRHATLLCAPKFAGLDFIPTAGGPFSGFLQDRFIDSRYQIDLQPAAASIFRYFQDDATPFAEKARPGFIEPPLNNNSLIRDDSPPRRPSFGSGVVDIATGSLNELRPFILDAPPFNAARPPSNTSPIAFDAKFTPHNTAVNFPQNLLDATGAAETMRRWMREALPTDSDAPFNYAGAVPGPPNPANTNDRGGRIRYQPTPPNYVGYDLLPGTNFPNPQSAPLAASIARADQTTLAAFQFVPRCTEFIVEWSFGDRYPLDYNFNTRLRGQLRWHGLPRAEDLDADETFGTNEYTVSLYGYAGSNGTAAYPNPNPAQPNPGYAYVDVTTGQASVPAYPPPAPTGASLDPRKRNRRVEPFLIHDAATINELTSNVPPRFAYSYFGYVDPSYAKPTGAGAPTNARDTAPWPWPKLLRVTMSLADPQDPKVEQTFQFIFEVPQPEAQ